MVIYIYMFIFTYIYSYSHICIYEYMYMLLYSVHNTNYTICRKVKKIYIHITYRI